MADEVMFLVEDDIPVPKKPNFTEQLRQLKPKESFTFPRESRSTVQTLTSKMKAQGKEFTVGVVDDETCRVWRTK